MGLMSGCEASRSSARSLSSTGRRWRCFSTGGGGVFRPGLSGERHHPSVDRAPLADHHGKGGTVPPHAACEFRTDRVFADLATAHGELDEWVAENTTVESHSAIGMIPSIERFTRRPQPSRTPAAVMAGQDRSADDWVGRRAGANGVISVSWQQICLGNAAAGHNVDVHVTDRVLQVWEGNQLLKTVARTSPGD